MNWSACTFAKGYRVTRLPMRKFGCGFSGSLIKSLGSIDGGPSSYYGVPNGVE